jgi:nitroreductase
MPTSHQQDRIQSRYGQAHSVKPPSSKAAAALFDHLLAHRTVRSLQSKALEEGMLEQLIAAAQSAASSSNLQTWSVVAVRDSERKARLASYAGNQAHIRECPLLLVWLADLSRLERIGDHIGQETAANQYLEMFLMACIDASLAAQNAVLCAEALGLGTVYIGAMRNKPESVIQELGLPPKVFPVFGLCIGYPKAEIETAVKPRLPQSVVLHMERYQHEHELASVQAYDQIMRQFQRSQAMAEIDWSLHSTQRVADARSLNGRDRLAEAIRAQGFPIR